MKDLYEKGIIASVIYSEGKSPFKLAQD